MTEHPTSEAYLRLLQVAGELFAKHGYAAVRLKDIASAAGLHHATLYHHAPGGKVELFIKSTELGIAQHAEALAAIMAKYPGDARLKLRGVASYWFSVSAPGNLARFLGTDLKSVDPAIADRLVTAVFEGLMQPVYQALLAGLGRLPTDKDQQRCRVVASAYIASLQAIVVSRDRPSGVTAEEDADLLIDVLLQGLSAD